MSGAGQQDARSALDVVVNCTVSYVVLLHSQRLYAMHRIRQQPAQLLLTT